MDRSVANLTTEQLYRKRAFDRVNQRASRARKKSRITELEEEVAELKQQLARSEDEVRRLQTNEVALRQAIDTARSSLRVLDGATPSQTAIPSPPASTRANGSVCDDVSSAGEEGSSQVLCLRSGHTQASPLVAKPSQNNVPTDDPTAFALRDGTTGLTLDLPFSQDFSSIFNFGTGAFPTDFSSPTPLSLSFLDHIPLDASTISTDLPTSDNIPAPSEKPSWERLPPHLPPQCRLDTVLLELVQSARQAEQSSGPIPELSGQAFPSIGSLLNPETQNPQTPISSAIGKHGRITMDVPELPAKIAMMYNFCNLLRWLISPTKRNYELMPEFLRPVEAQLTVPHPVWIDTVIWPEARKSIIHHMDWSQFPIFRELANQSVSINWPHGKSQVFTALSQNELKLNPLFENHIRNKHNWTVGPELFEQFPFLKDLKEEEEEEGQEK